MSLTPVRIPLACAAIALVAGLAAVAASVGFDGGNPTLLVRMSQTEGMAERARATDPAFQFVPPEAHYDGVYAYTIARDPLARDEDHQRIDRFVYRYGHPGYGWLARMVVAARLRLIPVGLMALGILGITAGAFLVSLIAQRMGRSGWGGLFVALNPGLLFAITVDTPEPIGVAMAALGLWLWMNARWMAAIPFLAFACLIKEPFIVVPAALGAWELLQKLRGRPTPGWVKRICYTVAAVLPFAGWYISMRVRFGTWPFSDAPEVFKAPFTGWHETFELASRFARTAGLGSQVGTAATPILIAVGFALLVGVVKSLRLRSPVDVMFLGFALAAFSLSWLGLLFPKDLIRLLAVAFIVLPGVLGPAPPQPVTAPPEYPD